MQVEVPEEEWWEGTEMGLLRVYWFDGNVTSSDGSVGTDSMGAGFVWMDRSKCGSERVGREEGNRGCQVGESGDGSLCSVGNAIDKNCYQLSIKSLLIRFQ